MRYYTKEHEWIEKRGDRATVGITAYAAEQLGDVVYVELPEIGKALIGGKEAAVVESVKAASDVYAPVAGFVVERNEALVADPSLVNKDAFGQGWFFKIDPTDDADWSGLMDETAYQNYTKG